MRLISGSQLKTTIVLIMFFCFSQITPVLAQKGHAPRTAVPEQVTGEDQESGAVKTFYPDGTLREEYTNKDGRRHGIYREYNPAGMLKTEIDYDQGEVMEIRNYDESRRLITKILKENVADENFISEKSHLMALHQCVSDEAGLKFACNPNWTLSRRGKTLTITVSLIPRVEFIIEESDLRLKTIKAFNREAITSLDRFEEGFEIQRVEQCGRETVNVNGYLRGDPDAKVMDFFMLDHGSVHSVQFTVKPKEVWPEYEDLFNKIVESLEFTEHKPGVRFSLSPTDENCEELVDQR